MPWAVAGTLLTQASLMGVTYMMSSVCPDGLADPNCGDAFKVFNMWLVVTVGLAAQIALVASRSSYYRNSKFGLFVASVNAAIVAGTGGAIYAYDSLANNN